MVTGGFDALLPAIFRDVGYVGDGGWVDLLQVGPAGPFVNEHVEDVRRSAPVEASWTIDQEDDLTEVAPGPYRPVAISGRIDVDDGLDLPNQVLVSIDGILAGVGDLNQDDGGFAALLDERRLTPGEHDIELYLPTDQGTIQRVLQPGSG